MSDPANPDADAAGALVMTITDLVQPPLPGPRRHPVSGLTW
jgi:hypothetical protein